MKKLKDSSLQELIVIQNEFDELMKVETLAHAFGDHLDFGCSWYMSKKELAEGNETKASKKMLLAFHKLRLAIEKRKQEVLNQAAAIVAKQ